jgi:O-succinylbenzoic acid--CoA ligase
MPDRVAVRTEEGSVTYAELRVRAARAASALRALGARAGEPVALALPPGLAFVEALHGCLHLGAPVLPVDPRLAARERAALLEGVRVRVERPLEANGEREEPAPQAAAAVALIVPTSGTTGRARRIPLTWGNVQANAEGVRAALRLGEDERWLCPLPLSHVGGLMVLLRSALMGTTAVLGPAAQVADDDVTLASLVPTQLQQLLAAGARPGPSLRQVLLGGGPMPRALLARARAVGFAVRPSYGLTQACSTVTVAEPGDLETHGRPLPGLEVSLAGDGEIVVNGPSVSGSGPLHTGDLGRLDAAGRLTVTGRRADLIVTGGENVAPAEVEAALAEHPDVAEAAVFARPDPKWGEAVTALVVPRPGARPAAAALRAHCRARLAPFKVPKAFELVPELPRTESGKVRRAALR